jgi:hypothetical protein
LGGFAACGAFGESAEKAPVVDAGRSVDAGPVGSDAGGVGDDDDDAGVFELPPEPDGGVDSGADGGKCGKAGDDCGSQAACCPKLFCGGLTPLSFTCNACKGPNELCVHDAECCSKNCMGIGAKQCRP